ncbi:MAG: hypothetical protein CVU91_01505 [Firmicutes bacterium HGW-Firmicutes-16]|nr:MAG: hypothetical protein CVU91_01505 [Firmicutes bacterium HGW-Firmicutes-16]
MKKTISIISILIFCLCFLGACDEGLRIVGMEINTYPNRIVYIAGQDKTLDLSGGTVRYKLKDKQVQGSTVDMSDKISISVTHNIDFNKPGVYQVVLTNGNFPCSFAIQVISKDYIEDLNN